MNDLISRQAAIDAIKALWNDAPSVQHLSAMFDCEDAIRALPSAQPEIIRCRECKYADDMPIADGRYWCNYHKGYFSFCSEAKRKEE